jgi:hypothetical protein
MNEPPTTLVGLHGTPGGEALFGFFSSLLGGVLPLICENPRLSVVYDFLCCALRLFQSLHASVQLHLVNRARDFADARARL